MKVQKQEAWSVMMLKVVSFWLEKVHPANARSCPSACWMLAHRLPSPRRRQTMGQHSASTGTTSRVCWVMSVAWTREVFVQMIWFRFDFPNENMIQVWWVMILVTRYTLGQTEAVWSPSTVTLVTVTRPPTYTTIKQYIPLHGDFVADIPFRQIRPLRADTTL